MEQAKGQQHPLGIYFKIWALLFLLSTMSYLVDYFHVESYLRWSLILIFMIAKAGLIVSVFMHMMWERLALIYAITLPPLFIFVLVWLMIYESSYVSFNRLDFFSLAIM